jgi:hypothetical protein
MTQHDDYAPVAARFLAFAVSIIMVFGSAWLMLGPTLGLLPMPYGWIMAAQIGMPWFAVLMAWCFPKWYSLFHGSVPAGRASDDRCLALSCFFFPTVFTIAIYYDYVMLVRRAPVIPLACLIGATLLVGGGLRDPYLWAGDVRRHRGTLLFAIFASFFYGYAATLQLNFVLDRSPDTVFRSVVAGKTHTKGNWRLQIQPWGLEQETRKISVPPKLFKAVQPGDAVCMVQRAGALGIAWYTAQACPWKGGRVFFQSGGSL